MKQTDTSSVDDVENETKPSDQKKKQVSINTAVQTIIEPATTNSRYAEFIEEFKVVSVRQSDEDVRTVKTNPRFYSNTNQIVRFLSVLV